RAGAWAARGGGAMRHPTTSLSGLRIFERRPDNGIPGPRHSRPLDARIPSRRLIGPRSPTKVESRRVPRTNTYRGFTIAISISHATDKTDSSSIDNQMQSAIACRLSPPVPQNTTGLYYGSRY